MGNTTVSKTVILGSSPSHPATFIHKGRASMDVMLKVREHYEAAENLVGSDRVWATMLYGSQNYNLDTEDSDVDTKTMVFPTFEEVVLGRKMLSKELKIPDGSLSTVKDYRDMFKNYLKGNLNFVETLFTPYVIVNPKYQNEFDKLLSLRNGFVNYQPVTFVHMVAGMAKQKYVAMEKPFESKREILVKYGYDPKQLRHIVRLRDFLWRFVNYIDFIDCLIPEKEARAYLINLKVNPLPLEEARQLAQSSMSEIDNLVKKAEIRFDNEPELKSKLVEQLDTLSVEIFKKCIEI